MNSTSAAQMIDRLRTIFATHGLPLTLVSDHGPPFSSADFKNFMSSNGILHRRVLPYHPSSNGLAENMVRSLKQALNKAHRTDHIESKIAKFLATYRATLHSVTGRTPAELLLGKLPRTRLSLIHPCVSQRVSLATSTDPPEFSSGSSSTVVRFLAKCNTKMQSHDDISPTGTF